MSFLLLYLLIIYLLYINCEFIYYSPCISYIAENCRNDSLFLDQLLGDKTIEKIDINNYCNNICNKSKVSLCINLCILYNSNIDFNYNRDTHIKCSNDYKFIDSINILCELPINYISNVLNSSIEYCNSMDNNKYIECFNSIYKLIGILPIAQSSLERYSSNLHQSGSYLLALESASKQIAYYNQYDNINAKLLQIQILLDLQVYDMAYAYASELYITDPISSYALVLLSSLQAGIFDPCVVFNDNNLTNLTLYSIFINGKLNINKLLPKLNPKESFYLPFVSTTTQFTIASLNNFKTINSTHFDTNYVFPTSNNVSIAIFSGRFHGLGLGRFLPSFLESLSNQSKVTCFSFVSPSHLNIIIDEIYELCKSKCTTFIELDLLLKKDSFNVLKYIQSFASFDIVFDLDVHVSTFNFLEPWKNMYSTSNDYSKILNKILFDNNFNFSFDNNFKISRFPSNLMESDLNSIRLGYVQASLFGYHESSGSLWYDCLVSDSVISKPIISSKVHNSLLVSERVLLVSNYFSNSYFPLLEPKNIFSEAEMDAFISEDCTEIIDQLRSEFGLPFIQIEFDTNLPLRPFLIACLLPIWQITSSLPVLFVVLIQDTKIFLILSDTSKYVKQNIYKQAIKFGISNPVERILFIPNLIVHGNNILIENIKLHFRRLAAFDIWFEPLTPSSYSLASDGLHVGLPAIAFNVTVSKSSMSSNFGVKISNSTKFYQEDIEYSFVKLSSRSALSAIYNTKCNISDYFIADSVTKMVENLVYLLKNRSVMYKLRKCLIKSSKNSTEQATILTSELLSGIFNIANPVINPINSSETPVQNKTESGTTPLIESDFPAYARSILMVLKVIPSTLNESIDLLTQLSGESRKLYFNDFNLYSRHYFLPLVRELANKNNDVVESYYTKALVYREENKFGQAYLNFHKAMLYNSNQSMISLFLMEELKLTSIRLSAAEFTFGLEFVVSPTIKQIKFGEIVKRLNVNTYFCILIEIIEDSETMLSNNTTFITKFFESFILTADSKFSYNFQLSFYFKDKFYGNETNMASFVKEIEYILKLKPSIEFSLTLFKSFQKVTNYNLMAENALNCGCEFIMVGNQNLNFISNWATLITSPLINNPVLPYFGVSSFYDPSNPLKAVLSIVHRVHFIFLEALFPNSFNVDSNQQFLFEIYKPWCSSFFIRHAQVQTNWIYMYENMAQNVKDSRNRIDRILKTFNLDIPTPIPIALNYDPTYIVISNEN